MQKCTRDATDTDFIVHVGCDSALPHPVRCPDSPIGFSGTVLTIPASNCSSPSQLNVALTCSILLTISLQCSLLAKFNLFRFHQDLELQIIYLQ